MSQNRRTPTLLLSSDDSDFESDEKSSQSETMASTEESDEVYAGLAAEELSTEKLRAGETIEYYSMAFVFGDPRGYRVAKVLQVMQREREFPLRLDSQELLPKTLMIKRKLTRHGEELSRAAAVWRKIRTFTLVDGEVKGETRADRLNEGLHNAVNDAFKSLHTDGSKREKPRQSSATSSSSKDKAAKGSLNITTFMTAKVPAKKGSLEAVVTSSSTTTSLSSLGKSERFKKQQDMSGFMTKSGNKRSRIELTPSPYKHREKEREQERLSSLKSRQHKDDRRHNRDRAHSPQIESISRLDKPGKRKVDLQRYVDQVNEQKNDPRLDLNGYLDLDRKQEEATKELRMIEEEESCPREECVGHTGTNRMRASNQSDKKRRGKHIRTKSLHNYYRAPPRLDPDAKPDAEQASGPSKLSFIMDTENNCAFASSTKVRKSDSQDSKSRCRDVAAQKKKGLSSKSSNLDTWLTTKR